MFINFNQYVENCARKVITYLSKVGYGALAPDDRIYNRWILRFLICDVTFRKSSLKCISLKLTLKNNGNELPFTLTVSNWFE